MATPVIWTGPINFRTGPIAGARASTDVRDRSFMAEAGAGGGGGGGGGGAELAKHVQWVIHIVKWVELEMSLYCGS